MLSVKEICMPPFQIFFAELHSAQLRELNFADVEMIACWKPHFRRTSGMVSNLPVSREIGMFSPFPNRLGLRGTMIDVSKWRNMILMMR
jgi:hypothetical protein